MTSSSNRVYKQVQVKGGQIHAFLVPAPSRPRVVFLHGGPGDTHDYMLRMAEPLFSDFECLFFDQRGTGGSSVERQPELFRLPILIDDLAAVVAAFGGAPVALVGHSWGAMYGLYAGLARPELFTRLALLNMGPLDSETEQETTARLMNSFTPDERVRFEALRTRRKASTDRAVIAKIDAEMMQTRVKSWIFREELREPFLEEYFRDPPCDREVNKWIWQDLKPVWDEIPKLQVPTWLAIGANDGVPPAQAERLVHLNKRMRLTEYRECGHMPWLEHRDDFYRDLRAWLATPVSTS